MDDFHPFLVVFLYYLSAWEVLRSGTKFRFVGGSVIGPLQSTRVYMVSIIKNNNGIQRTYPTGIKIVVPVKYFPFGGYLKVRNFFEYPSCYSDQHRSKRVVCMQVFGWYKTSNGLINKSTKKMHVSYWYQNFVKSSF